MVAPIDFNDYQGIMQYTQLMSQQMKANIDSIQAAQGLKLPGLSYEDSLIAITNQVTKSAFSDVKTTWENEHPGEAYDPNKAVMFALNDQMKSTMDFVKEFNAKLQDPNYIAEDPPELKVEKDQLIEMKIMNTTLNKLSDIVTGIQEKLFNLEQEIQTQTQTQADAQAQALAVAQQQAEAQEAALALAQAQAQAQADTTTETTLP